MGIFKNLQELFKSPKERVNEEKQRLRGCMRNLERAAEMNDANIAQLQRAKQESWNKASDYMKKGCKPAARREIQNYRLNDVLIAQLSQKNLICRHFMMAVESAQTSASVAEAMNSLNSSLGVDLEALNDVFEKTGDFFADQNEFNKAWDRFARQTANASDTQCTETVENVDDLMAQLESVAGAEIAGQADFGQSNLDSANAYLNGAQL